MTEQKNRIWGIALKDGTYKMYVAEYDQWSFSVIAECVAFKEGGSYTKEASQIRKEYGLSPNDMLTTPPIGGLVSTEVSRSLENMAKETGMNFNLK